MGHDLKTLVFGKGLRSDIGQSRGAQSGEADRHSVWMTANNLEPKLSPFDPFAILDEIQRLVPGYDKLLRLQLLSGNDQHIVPAASGLVQITPPARTSSCPAPTPSSPPAPSPATRPCFRTFSATNPPK